MARLETEINQIYLTHPESKKSSLVLYEEELSGSAHLFILAELNDLQKKSEAHDLKKISEIILTSFRANKKLSSEALFEASLAQINQNLADLAHEGRKSWVGKFSCLIALSAKGGPASGGKSTDNIYLANNGQTSGLLLRKSELLEILQPEKRGTHPLKTFVNFTQGKLQEDDTLIITTSNIFDYVSWELFKKILSSKPAGIVVSEISKILQDSMSPDQGFCTFLLNFSKKGATAANEETRPSETIYAPLPEEMDEEPARSWKIPSFPKLPFINIRFPEKFSIPKLSIPRISIPKIRWEWFRNLSTAGKFFFVSFSIFLLLFLGNLAVYAGKTQGKNKTDKITALVATINNDISDAQSALIYKSDKDALQYLNQAYSDFKALEKLSTTKASELVSSLQTLKDQVNKVSVIADPKTLIDLKHDPTFLSRSSIGFLFANRNSNSLSLFTTTLKDYFLLNSLKSDITGIGNYSPAGVVVSASDTIYHIDQNLKQIEPIITIANSKLIGLETSGNFLYSLNTNANQVVKMGFAKNKYISSAINAGSLADIRDFGLDKDFYLLYPDKLVKLTGGQIQAFAFPPLSDSITNADKIYVGVNLYILEANKKRVVIMNKNGQLLNQIYLPNTNNLTDLVVDEPSRSLYLLGNNKLYKITF